LLACGWYLTAVLHGHSDETWLERRVTGSGYPLSNQSPLVCWLHSIYFVLTVFTTVGLGDISPATALEILYVCFAMLVGTVMNSVVVSEMVNLLAHLDQTASELKRQQALVQAFSEHVRLDESCEIRMLNVIEASRILPRPSLNREEINKVFTSGALPQALLSEVPKHIFKGNFLRNRFLTKCAGPVRHFSHQLPLELAVMLVSKHYAESEKVYSCHDTPSGLFLVLHGTFASVAQPSSFGGITEADPIMVNADAELCFPKSHSNPAPSKGKKNSRLQFLKALSMGSKAAPRGIHPSWNVPKSFSDLVAPRLYPYKLWSERSYFGEVELMHGGPRSATVRCESPAGSLLLLKSADFARLMEEFPHYGSVWRKIAPRQETMRIMLLRQLKRGRSYRHLAASMIQQKVREILLPAALMREPSPLPLERRSHKSLRSSGGSSATLLGLTRSRIEDLEHNQHTHSDEAVWKEIAQIRVVQDRQFAEVSEVHSQLAELLAVVRKDAASAAAVESGSLAV